MLKYLYHMFPGPGMLSVGRGQILTQSEVLLSLITCPENLEHRDRDRGLNTDVNTNLVFCH